MNKWRKHMCRKGVGEKQAKKSVGKVSAKNARNKRCQKGVARRTWCRAGGRKVVAPKKVSYLPGKGSVKTSGTGCPS